MNRLAFLFFSLISCLAGAQSDVGADQLKNEGARANFEKSTSGLFPIQNFTHQETGGHHQNWCITQDKNGFIYTGNGNGILEYDGVSWRLISSTGLHAVRSVVVDKNNVKWVGADRDLGYLQPDSLGFLQFKSLKHKIPSSHPLMGNVWQIFADHERILFVTESVIYNWNDNHFQAIPRQGEIQRGNQVNGNLYFRISGKGMFRLNGDALELIPDGEKFKDVRVDVVLPFGKNSVLFASREAGLFVFDGRVISKFENDLDDYLITNNLYAGLQLCDSIYAFATLRGGVILMDTLGRRTNMVRTNEGILNNQVYGMVKDNRNAVWLALQTGISQVEPFLPYTFHDKKSGLEGTVSTITRHQGKLYVGTYDGLFGQDMITHKFQRVEGVQNGCFSLLSVGEHLFAGSANGVFIISDAKVREIKKLTACRALWLSTKNPNRIFVGHRGGLSTLHFKNGQWQHERDFEEVDVEIRSIVESNEGDLWLGTTLHQIINIQFPGLKNEDRRLDPNDFVVKYYDERDGLPKETNSVYLIDGDILVLIFGDNRSLYKFDKRSNKFSGMADFGKRFGLDSLSIYPIGYQKDGDYILLESGNSGGRSYRFAASRESDAYDYSVRRIYDDRFQSTTENSVYWDRADLLWFGGENITRYNLKIPIDVTPHFSTHIRKVTIGQDATIYGGENVPFKSVLNYSNNGFRFEFATPGFLGKETNKYQYQLIGFDSKWSDWTKETKKDYTNLPEGDYQFAVRSQNIYGEISKADLFTFEILAPWYRTWYAYTAYALLFVGLLFVVLQLRARKLESEKRALALLVAERTEEIRSQANQLKVQAEKLQELHQAKSRFFANISHEFRTPLTLIAGCLEDLKTDSDSEENQSRISIMEKNTVRLRQLIEQLLDLSKLENGKLSLAVAPLHPGNFLRAITSSFSSWASQKNIALTVHLPENPAEAFLDEDVMQKIINNLLSNAIKFTPQGGEVSLLGRWDESELVVHVKDSGPGIPKPKLNQIFERFYQVDDTNTRAQEGSGIGLALVKELISLHHGRISVESEIGTGTLFMVRIPVRKTSYSSSEICLTQKNRTSPTPLELNKNLLAATYSEYMDGSAEGPLILVVEDNVDLGQYIGDHLPDYGIIRALNGRDGLKKAVHHVPDLIISDVMMPEMDGVELCTKIKAEEKTSHIPIILLTAKADLASRLEGLQTGADDYMTKPFDALELQTRVKNLIAQRAKLRERFSRTVVLKPKEISVTPPDEIFLKKVMAIVENHLSDSEFSVDDFQTEIGMSRMQLHRKLKALTGHSTAEFIRIQRLIRASELLSKTDDNVSEVCYQTGFASLSYFAKCFKKQFGVTPKDFASMQSQTQ